MSRIAIVSAMTEELGRLHEHLDPGALCERHGGRDFWVGRMDGRDVVIVLSRIGKVAAATTATLLASHFDVSALVFTGAAGGIGPHVQVGDVVVATGLLQHDMDASPIFPRFEVPLYGADRFAADIALSSAVAAAVADALAPDAPHATDGLRPALAALAAARAAAGLPPHQPRLHQGLVLSGDCFVSSRAQCDQLLAWHPEALAVEMEGAALAQVCADFGLPFAVVRTISDRADDQAHVDFPRFIAETASRYTLAIVSGWLKGPGGR
ncbi:MAG: 5'-methylthioadenosine/adenosylhomocysteine nucleosidase [Ideonella sp.]|nr:5'-methylthioadenosine/adenosylhomocysteine nucleosidase [Ideonella sp.]